jgi:CubicO group peptidase (beta-lactamase class C family)
VWTTEELLETIPHVRGPLDVAFGYSSTNYVLLGLVIEHVRGRPLVQVLRNGVLDVPGTERLISQPEERPTAPMAMPFGESTAALQEGGGYLPSAASVTSNGPGAVIASDALPCTLVGRLLRR